MKRLILSVLLLFSVSSLAWSTTSTPLPAATSTKDAGGSHHEELNGEHKMKVGVVREFTFHVVERGGWAFAPSVIKIPLGQPVTLTLMNDGQSEHDFEVTGIPAEHVEAVVSMEGHSQLGRGHHAEGIVAAHAMSQMTASVMFTPTRIGEYEIHCTIPGHKEAGMVGKLVVSEMLSIQRSADSNRGEES